MSRRRKGQEPLTDDGHDLAQRMLRETREELVRADGKAQILFAASGVVISVILGGILAGDWRPSQLSCLGQSLWWAGVSATAVGIAALGAGIFPQLASASSGRVTYFEEVRKHELEELVPALNAEAAHKGRDVEQLLRLSQIVHIKYWAVRVAIGAFVLAAALCVAAVLVG
jgi:hypothetical protein